jgi:hypothetical protein
MLYCFALPALHTVKVAAAKGHLQGQQACSQLLIGTTKETTPNYTARLSACHLSRS